MTNKTNKKATEKVNANVANANDIIANFANATNGLLKSALGTKKATLYKENILPEDAKQKKSVRKKLRNILFSVCSSILQEENKEKQTKLIKAFNEFYFATYQTNDYSLQSVCNENLSKEKKDILIKALEICKS